MASANEPLKGRHGVLLYSPQVSQGTAVTPATAVGFASYEATSDPDLRTLYALGSANAQLFKPGVSKTNWSIDIEAVQVVDFLALAARTGGVLPWFTLGMGATPDGGTNDSWQVQDCKMHSLQVSLESDGMLKAAASGVGGLITDLSSLAPAYLSETPFFAYEAVLTKGGSAYKARSFSFQLENNVDVQSCIPGAAPSGNKRGWAYQTEGQIAVSGEITRYAKSGVDFHASLISEFDLELVCTDIAGGGSPNSIALAITDAKFGSEKRSLSPDGDLLFTTPFVAKGFSLA